MIDHLWSQVGFVAGDVSLGLIATVCALLGYVEIATHSAGRDPAPPGQALELLRHALRCPLAALRSARSRVVGAVVARWMVALGWTIIAIRIWYALVVHGDAPIAAASVLALSLIGSGWIVLNMVRSE